MQMVLEGNKKQVSTKGITVIELYNLGKVIVC
jgi:hypothetical protein